MRVGMVNCHRLPEPDPDEAPLLAALRGAGHEAACVGWDDPEADPASFDVLVLRATWNYYDQPDRFLAWLERPEVASRVWNKPGIVRGNMHKGYLLDLEQRGVPIVPTEVIAAGTTPDLASLLDRRGWDDVVVKPAVSGGSPLTRRFRRDEAGEGDSFLGGWLGGEDAIVQPYLSSIEGKGGARPERAIMWIDGEVTHAIEKTPRFIGQPEAVHLGAELSEDDRDFALRTVEASGHDLLYARVDVMDDEAGRTLLSELELIEPSLYFDNGPGSAERLVKAIERRVSGG